MRLWFANALLYLTLTVLALAALAQPLKASARAVFQRFSYAPAVLAPWLWLAIAVALLLAVAEIGRRMAARQRVGLLRYGVLLALCGVCVAARRGLEAPAKPAPLDALSHLLARTELAADRAFARDRRYPVEAAVLASEFPSYLRDLGYRARGGRALQSRLFVVEQAREPVFRAPAGVGPGDLVFALDEGRRRYWLTAFRLDARGRLVPLVDGTGRVLVATAAEGRAASRLDPLFPEYPRKTPIGPRGPRSAPAGRGAPGAADASEAPAGGDDPGQ